MRLLLNIAIMLAAALHVHSQNRTWVSLELGGNGGLYSVNLEKSLLFDKPDHWQWRGGISIIPSSGRIEWVVPAGISYLAGKTGHYMELGLGQGIAIAWDYTNGWVHAFPRATATLGYRWMPADSRWFFRLAYTPLVSYLVDFQYQHWGGITAGYRLK